MTPTPGEAVDAVVVGSGPNGLAAAITLARAGRSVHVIEAGETVGGGCRSAALTLPGFVHDTCATIQSFGDASPAFGALDLARHGVRLLRPPIAIAHPLDDGRAGLLHASLDATAAGLGRRDGQRWRTMVGPSLAAWDRLAGELLQPLVRVPRHPLAMARFGMFGVLPASMLAERFSGDEAQALFGGCAAHSFLPLNRALTASFGLVLALTAHGGGWPVAEGGSQRLADALAAELRELGGRIELGRRARSIDELPPHRVALFDTDPRQLASIAGTALPARYVARLRRFRFGPAAYKVDYALDGPLPWTNTDARRAGTVHLGGSLAEVAAAEADVARGTMPERPFVLAVQATIADPSRAPAGKHTLWAYAHVPNGCTIDATAAIERQIERFAPGFRDLVLARHTTSPQQLEARNPNLVGGDIAGGSAGGVQLAFRPTVQLRSYVTPNPKILLCSASTPPGGGVHGMCGHNAARRALAGPLR